MKLLVTGFPRFDAFPENATEALIESMRNDPPQEMADLDPIVSFDIVRFENDNELVQQQTMLASLDALLEQHQPHACLFCGQAASRPRIELEMLAINVFKGRLIDPSGPPAYWSTLPKTKDLLDAIRQAEIPAALSYYAGTHLCNHILYTALRRAEQTESGMQCGFVHLPMTATQVIRADENRPFVPLAFTRQALMLAIRHLVDHTA